MSDEIKDFKGNIKNKKPFNFVIFKKIGKVLLTTVLSVGIALGSAFAFTGCKKNTKPAPERPSASQPADSGNSSDSSYIEEKQTYLNEFLTIHKAQALEFAQDNFKEMFTQGRDVVSEDWSFSSNGLGEITSIKLNYTYTGENNMRTRENVEYLFAFPVDIDKILDGYEFTSIDLSGVTYRNEIFSWDAKQNFCQEDLKNALVEACGVEGTSYFREVENEDETKKSYEIAISNDENKTIVYSVEVENADSIEEIISNLADSEKTNVSMKDHFSLGDNQIDVSTYTQEEFQPENVQDLITNFDNDLHKTLNEIIRPQILQNCFSDYIEENLYDIEWRIATNEDNQVTEIKLLQKNKRSTKSTQQRVDSIVFETPVDINIFSSEEASTLLTPYLQNAIYNIDYAFMYSPTAQETRADLMNTIFEAKGMGLEKPEGAERFIVEVGSHLHQEVGESRQFQIMQLEDDKITQYTVFVKECETDEQYILMFKDENNYSFEYEVILELQGEVLQYKELIQSIEEDLEI